MLYAVVTEATDELERAQKDQDRLQDELVPGNYPTVGPRKKQQLQKQAAPSEKSAINAPPTRRSALKLGKRGKEHTSTRECFLPQGANKTLLQRTCQG